MKENYEEQPGDEVAKIGDVNSDDNVKSEPEESEKPKAESPVTMWSAEDVKAMLREAYMQGRNENIEARIATDCRAERKAETAEMIIRGIAGVAKAIFRPGRRSVWPFGRR